MDPYRFSVKAQLTSRPRVIAEIKEACRRVGAAAATSDPAAAAVDWESTFVDAIVSAVSEAMNNIVLHACGGGTDDPVDFDIQAGPSSLVVRITDRGAPAQFVDPAPEPPPLAEGGMGMYLIHACVDRFEYQPGPPNVWTLEKQYPDGGTDRPNQE